MHVNTHIQHVIEGRYKITCGAHVMTKSDLSEPNHPLLSSPPMAAGAAASSNFNEMLARFFDNILTTTQMLLRRRLSSCSSGTGFVINPIRFGQIPTSASEIFVHMDCFEGIICPVSFKFACGNV